VSDNSQAVGLTADELRLFLIYAGPLFSPDCRSPKPEPPTSAATARPRHRISRSPTGDTTGVPIPAASSLPAMARAAAATRSPTNTLLGSAAGQPPVTDSAPHTPPNRSGFAAALQDVEDASVMPTAAPPAGTTAAATSSTAPQQPLTAALTVTPGSDLDLPRKRPAERDESPDGPHGKGAVAGTTGRSRYLRRRWGYSHAAPLAADPDQREGSVKARRSHRA